MRCSVRWFSLVLAVCGFGSAPAMAQWQWSNPDSYGGNINDVEWAVNPDVNQKFNRYVAVGDSGVILRSDDGRNWQQTTVGERALYDVFWTGSQFIVVGLDGTILTSDNGIDWFTQSSGTHQSLNSVARSDGGLLVIVGSQGVVLRSTDGNKWNPQSTNSNVNLRRVLWANGRFVAIGTRGDILSSADAQTWTVGNDTRYGILRDIVWTGGQYLVLSTMGYVLTSSDAVNWSVQDVPMEPGDWLTAIVNHGLTTLVSSGLGKIFSLEQGSWRKVYDGTGTINAVIWSQGQFVASRFDAGTQQGAILASTNGLVWSQLPAEVYRPGRLSWNGTQYLALSDGASNVIEVSSSNLSQWDVTWPLSNDIRGAITGIAWNGSDAYVAISNLGGIYSSPDALAWTVHGTVCGEDNVRACWGDVIWAQGMFVAVGDAARILTSTDGIDWQARAPGFTVGVDDNFTAVIHHGNRFVVVGAGGRIVTSDDGIAWTARTSNSSLNLTGIVWGNNEYLAVGNVVAERDYAGGVGGVLRSGDGVTWTPVAASSLGWLGDIAWNGQFYAAVGDGFYTSDDGVQWSKRSDQEGYDVQSVDGHFIVVDGFNISQTDDFSTWRSLVNIPNLSFVYQEFLWTGSQFLLGGSNGELILHAGWPQFSAIPPLVSVTVGAEQTVTAGDLVQLSGTASDSDGELIFSYWWSWDWPEPQWLSTPLAASTAFIAPDVSSRTEMRLVFSANDTDGLYSYAYSRITVLPAGPPPVVNAGDDIIVASGSEVSLRGEAQGAGIRSYRWEIIEGPPVELRGADTLQPGFTAPVVTQTTRMVLRLTVVDSRNHEFSDEVAVTVQRAGLRAKANHHKSKWFGAMGWELPFLLLLLGWRRLRPGRRDEIFSV